MSSRTMHIYAENLRTILVHMDRITVICKVFFRRFKSKITFLKLLEQIEYNSNNNRNFNPNESRMQGSLEKSKLIKPKTLLYYTFKFITLNREKKLL